MGRLSPPVLLSEHHYGEYGNQIIEEVLEAQCLYGVLYQGEPFNLRTSQPYSAAKYYKPVTSVSLATSTRLADRLNKKFNTTEFTVHELGAKDE